MSAQTNDSGRSEKAPNYRQVTAVSRLMVIWSGMSMSAMSPLLPQIKTLYHVSVIEVSWVYALLILGSAVALSTVPRLSDTCLLYTSPSPRD